MLDIQQHAVHSLLPCRFHHGTPLPLCVEDIEALLTHELIVNVRKLLVHVIAEGLLCVEIGASTVRADKLPVVALCGSADEPTNVMMNA